MVDERAWERKPDRNPLDAFIESSNTEWVNSPSDPTVGPRKIFYRGVVTMYERSMLKFYGMNPIRSINPGKPCPGPDGIRAEKPDHRLHL